MRTVATALLAGLLILAAQTGSASCAELKIFGSRVTKVVVAELAPQFEQATGFKPVVVADVAAVMKRKIEAGEPFDLAVLVNFQADALIKSGQLLADSRADVMRAGIGVAVKRGAPKPDIGTVEAFRRTLLAAKSITYLKEGASTIQLNKVFAQLGIADALKAKTVQPMTESVSEMVADGEVELAMIVIPNILSVPGAELVGPLPVELNSYIVFTAGVSAQSPNQQAAREMIKLLKSPAAAAVIKAKGMEPG
jgi:molybdate transport system substrate-binding protein